MKDRREIFGWMRKIATLPNRNQTLRTRINADCHGCYYCERNLGYAFPSSHVILKESFCVLEMPPSA